MSDDSPILDRDPIATSRALELLTDGEIDLVGRMPYSSNATFLADIEHEGLQAQVIYKPLPGERPLWDFPDGLYQREIAAFEVSEMLGWGRVPPTIERDDLVHGVGSVQLFMPSHFDQHYFTLFQASDRYHDEFRQICALDIVMNNTDRKSGHCLLGTDDQIWAIDHGVAFHQEFKLRTVIWDFADEPLPEELQDDLWRFRERGVSSLERLLSPFERDAIVARTTALATTGRFPEDDSGGHRWPWPLDKGTCNLNPRTGSPRSSNQVVGRPVEPAARRQG